MSNFHSNIYFSVYFANFPDFFSIQILVHQRGMREPSFYFYLFSQIVLQMIKLFLPLHPLLEESSCFEEGYTKSDVEKKITFNFDIFFC